MGTSRPLILVTNDDGILADGIVALQDALAPLGDVIVAAPSRQQSAVSHGISLNEPLRVRTVGPNRFAVAGTPADAVFIALAEICPRPPDLVVSGINHGCNLGTDVFYSGTLAGALEASLRGIPSMAISQQLPPTTEAPGPEASERSQKANAWDPLEHLGEGLKELLAQAARFATAIAPSLIDAVIPPGIALNVNSPSRPTEGYCWTRLGKHMYRAQVLRRVDPRGLPYYWIGDSGELELSNPGTDSHAIDAGLVSVTPIALDWTAALAEPPSLNLPGFTSLRQTSDPE